MATFTTIHPETGAAMLWTVRVDIGTVKSWRTALGVDMLAHDPKRLFGGLLDDIVRMVDALWLAVAPQAAAHGISEEAFAGLLGGDTLAAATDALVEAVEDFFPPARREMLRNLTGRMRAADAEILAAVEKEINRLTPGALSMSALASLESNPTA